MLYEEADKNKVSLGHGNILPEKKWILVGTLVNHHHELVIRRPFDSLNVGINLVLVENRQFV